MTNSESKAQVLDTIKGNKQVDWEEKQGARKLENRIG